MSATILLADSLGPKNGGPWPTHEDIYTHGGLMTVADTTARDAITTERRKEGMLVFVQADAKYYQLGSDLSTWTEFSGGGGGGTSYTRTLAGSSYATTEIGHFPIVAGENFAKRIIVSSANTGFNSKAIYDVTGIANHTNGEWHKAIAKPFSDDTKTDKPSIGLEIFVDSISCYFRIVMDRVLA